MTTQTMTLTDFLLARIAEDEAEAHRITGTWALVAEGVAERTHADVGWFVLHHGPRRALAECEAKRRIVEEHEIAPVRVSTVSYTVHPDAQRKPAYVGGGCFRCYEGDDCSAVTGEPDWCDTLKVLATVYSDHPDYRQEWAA